ncbi:MAG: hypothetical protein IJL12_02115 [Selenomonadaceae bacterium]|nr:hypothetical protein [Selenomonadaceae bacterium]MBQ6131122.1 hypothetical protein [Selenomonadaceae bacterium]
MAVNSMAGASWGVAQYTMQARKTTDTKSAAQNQTTQAQSEQTKVGDAFELSLSPEAKQAVLQSKDTPVEEAGAKEAKGLSAEQVDALKADLETQQQTMLNIMIQALTDSNDKLQGWLDEGVGILNFDGVQIDAARFALPEVATNPEDAAKAIAPGGDWSVDAVSTRIFDLATAIAGNDPEKLSQMKAAVEEGFKQAGLTWKDATGQSKLPEISNQTYNEIMSRFDKRANELNGTSVVE